MRFAIPLLLVLFVVGCSDSDTPMSLPELKGKPAAVQLVESRWDKLLNHCPGLNQYQKDLLFNGINDWTYLDGAMSRVEVEFKVSDDPEKIPNSFKAWGNTCALGISSDGKNIRIQKNVCVSICLGKSYNDINADYVATL